MASAASSTRGSSRRSQGASRGRSRGPLPPSAPADTLAPAPAAAAAAVASAETAPVAPVAFAGPASPVLASADGPWGLSLRGVPPGSPSATTRTPAKAMSMSEYSLAKTNAVASAVGGAEGLDGGGGVMLSPLLHAGLDGADGGRYS